MNRERFAGEGYFHYLQLGNNPDEGALVDKMMLKLPEIYL
jgi:hypothetical protein